MTYGCGRGPCSFQTDRNVMVHRSISHSAENLRLPLLHQCELFGSARTKDREIRRYACQEQCFFCARRTQNTVDAVPLLSAGCDNPTTPEIYDSVVQGLKLPADIEVSYYAGKL